MEDALLLGRFQFGTNWAKFSAFAGGVIGQTLALAYFVYLFYSFRGKVKLHAEGY